jgi:periplasmic copper chaperone A
MKGLPVLQAALCGIATLLAVPCPIAPAADRLAAENAWIPWAPPAIKVHAAYLTVVNRSNVDQVIIGAESPDYERVELHGSSIRDGVNEMRSLDRIPVPAHERVTFAPGGLHVMLINPKRAYGVDERIHLVLRLGSGDQVEASAVIRRRERGNDRPHRHHEGRQ